MVASRGRKQKVDSFCAVEVVPTFGCADSIYTFAKYMRAMNAKVYMPISPYGIQ